ncbi:MAG: hypothetical protein SV775_17105 [Thermodesulfobacteriota bacterium]|nr:hypothetical protein [Thermodesulfobacteriota bacterium]
MSFTSIGIFVLGAIAGALIEIVITIIFEDTARLWYRRIGRTLKWLISLLRTKVYPLSHDLFQIGKWVTNCIVLEGYGEKYYSTYRIVCHLDSDSLVLPQDMAHLKDNVTRQQEKIKKTQGHSVYYNGPMVAFIDYSVTRTAIYEDPLLYLRFKPTDYYTFLSTAMSLRETIPSENGLSTTVWEKYLSKMNLEKPIPFMATSFGVNLAVITSDGYLVIGKRGHKGLSHYRDHLQVPICESVHPYMDSMDGSRIDIYKTAIRGAREELGVEVKPDEVRLFSLCVDTTWYLYGLTGVIYMESFTKHDIISRRSIGIKDKWEISELVYLRLDPKEIVLALKNMGGPSHWHPASFVSIVQTLVNLFGVSLVEESFKTIRPS